MVPVSFFQDFCSRLPFPLHPGTKWTGSAFGRPEWNRWIVKFARSLQGVICRILHLTFTYIYHRIYLQYLAISGSTWQSTWHCLNHQVINPTVKVLLMELGTSFVMFSSASIHLKLDEDRQGLYITYMTAYLVFNWIHIEYHCFFLLQAKQVML